MRLIFCLTIFLVHILLNVKANEGETAELDSPSWEEDGCDYEDISIEDNRVKIQTDKCVYNAGDTIKFKVLSMDKVRIQDITIFNTNEFLEVKLQVNVSDSEYKGEMDISESETTSLWVLKATSEDGSIQEVYVNIIGLLKMEVPEYVWMMDVVNVVVTSHDISGTPVNGIAYVDLYFYDYGTTVHLNETFSMVNGKSSFHLDVKDYSDYMSKKPYDTEVDITVKVVDSRFPDLKMHTTAGIFIHPYRYAISCESYENCETFEPNKEEDVLLKITNIDGSSPNDTKSTVELIFVPNISGTFDSPLDSKSAMELVTSGYLTFEGHMNEAGIVNFKQVSLPALTNDRDLVPNYFLYVKYLDQDTNIGNAYQKLVKSETI